MFLSIESKHPKFYQVFRVFIVFFASILYAWKPALFCEKLPGLFPGGFAGSVPALTENRADLFPY